MTYLVEFFAPGMHGQPLLVYFAHVQAQERREALVKARSQFLGLGKRQRLVVVRPQRIAA